MKYVEEYLKDVVKVKPLGELTTKDEQELNGMSGEMVYIDGKCTDIFISHADYANWLEKQKPRDIIHIKYDKPANKIVAKFKVGDWIVTDKKHIWLIDEDCSTTGYSYRLISQNGKVEVGDYNIVDEHARLWTIQDAKDGDVLASELCDSIILFRGIKDDNIDFYCDYDFSKIDIPGDRFSINDGQHYGDVEDSKDFYPATKEQRDTLLKAMTDAGWEFDFEKKELKKIEEKFQLEVDLDYIKDELDKVVKIYKPVGDFGWGTLYNVAQHFFELGLNTQHKISYVPNIDDSLKELGVDPSSKEAKIFKESYYIALEKLKAQKGE